MTAEVFGDASANSAGPRGVAAVGQTTRALGKSLRIRSLSAPRRVLTRSPALRSTLRLRLSTISTIISRSSTQQYSGNGGGDFAKASQRELRKQNSGEAPANIGKGVAVEEKKRRAAMAAS